MVTVSSQRVRDIRQANERDIRIQSLRAVSALLCFASLLLWWFLLSLDRPAVPLLAVAATLLLLYALAYYLADRAPRRVGVMTLLATTFFLVAVGLLRGTQEVVILLALPGLIAAGVFGLLPGLALGTMLALAATLAPWPTPDFISGSELLVLTLAWTAIMLPRQRTLVWSWQRSAEATYLAEQLRDRQGELNRALAAVHVAYQLLERTNRELESAREEAEEARRLKEQFAASVSHELRTPLNIILGFAEIMYRTPHVYGLSSWPQMLHRDVAEIWSSARYISELVDDILELARVDALHMPVTRELTDLGTIVEETCALAERLIQGKPVLLERHLPPTLPPLPLDRTRIRQVLLNLLSNAARFTDEGRISVAAEVQDDEVHVSVSDTGVGMASHELQAIFEEFHRAEQHQDRGGKGLGLAIAKRFVQLHGGRIWAESQVGVGSTFHFTLPLQAKAVSRLGGTSGAPTSLAPMPKVVVVRAANTTDAAAFFARHLEGYEVIGSNRSDELATLVEREHPDAVIVDTAGADAQLALAGILEAVPAGVPVVALAAPGMRIAAASGHFDAFLTKPVGREQLLSTMRALVPKGKVLVVDDDRGFVQLVRRMVTSSDAPYEVHWAYDGEEALGRLKSVKPDLVLLDMVMPGMDGPTLAAAIHGDGAHKAAAIIAITGASPALTTVRPCELRLYKRSGLRDGEVLRLVQHILTDLRAGSTAVAEETAPNAGDSSTGVRAVPSA